MTAPGRCSLGRGKKPSNRSAACSPIRSTPTTRRRRTTSISRTGTIESLNVAAIAKLETAAVINGSNNQVVANSPEARIGTKDTIFTANHSPGAQLGRGNVANGNANTVQKTHIDYATVLPQIEQMQRFYAQNPHARPVEERLAELELLMRSGTPTTEGRSRVRDLAVDLSTLLQGYPAMVQFFQSIVHLAGF